MLEISSQPNDIVLDAFCACGTALVAAQKLKRQWIGIDISRGAYPHGSVTSEQRSQPPKEQARL
jgi:DNA modification methylase